MYECTCVKVGIKVGAVSVLGHVGSEVGGGSCVKKCTST